MVIRRLLVINQKSGKTGNNMSNLHNAKDDILQAIFLDKDYQSKEEVLFALHEFLDELQGNEDYSYQYLDAVQELLKEIDSLSFQEIRKRQEEYHLLDGNTSLPDDSYESLLDGEYLDNLYLVNDDEMLDEYHIERRIFLHDKRYVALRRIDDDQLFFVVLEEEKRRVEFVLDDLLIEELKKAYQA